MTKKLVNALLILAAKSRHTCIMEDLIIIMVQMSIQLKTFEAKHILHIAVKRAQGLSIKLLLDKGANMDVTNHKNSTPLHLAAEE